MSRVSKGLEEYDIQKMWTTPPEQLTNEKLLLTKFCVDDLQRKSSAAWNKNHWRHRLWRSLSMCGSKQCLKKGWPLISSVTHLSARLYWWLHSVSIPLSPLSRVKCFSCLSYAVGAVFFVSFNGLDQVIQNTLSDSARIRMQANVMSNFEFTTIAWGETLFKNTFATFWQIVQAVVSHQKSLILREVSQNYHPAGLRKNPLKYVGTRYGSKVLMGRCLLVTRSIYRNLMVDTEMETWLQRQKSDTQQKLNKEPGSVLYNMCLGLDKMHSESIDDLDESIRKKVHVLFMSWWNTFHAPVHSAWFLMDKAFCHMEHDSTVKLELIQVIKDFCTVETADGTKVGRNWKVVKSEYITWQEVIARKQHDLHDEHNLNQLAGDFT